MICLLNLPFFFRWILCKSGLSLRWNEFRKATNVFQVFSAVSVAIFGE